MADSRKHTFTPFAHANRDHDTTSSQLCMPTIVSPLFLTVKKPVAAGAGAFHTNSARRRVNEDRMATWSGIQTANLIILRLIPSLKG